MWVIGSASNQAEETQSDERLRGRRSVNLPSVTGKLCCLFRIHVTRCCKVHVYNRKIKVTYFPGLDIFSGDHRDERRRPPPAPEVRLTQQPSKKWIKKSKGTQKSRPKQYWQAAAKRSQESSQGSDKAKALSNGGVCQPPIAPRKSGEIF